MLLQRGGGVATGWAQLLMVMMMTVEGCWHSVDTADGGGGCGGASTEGTSRAEHVSPQYLWCQSMNFLFCFYLLCLLYFMFYVLFLFCLDTNFE